MQPKIYTKTGDDGTTGLLYGGRVRKDSWQIELNGVIDEAQAAIGLARAETPAGSEAHERLTALARDLYVVMAEVATAPENRRKLTAGSSLVTPDMVAALEAGIDDLLARFDMPSDFTMPGENRVAAALDLARTIVRRAERLAVAEPVGGLAGHGLPQPVVRPALGDGALAGGPEHALSKGRAEALWSERSTGPARRRPLRPRRADAPSTPDPEGDAGSGCRGLSVRAAVGAPAP